MSNKKEKKSFVFENVVGGDFCVGCGVCAAAIPKLQMTLSPEGQYLPQLGVKESYTPETDGIFSSVCPFSDQAEDEDSLAKDLYAKNCGHNLSIGFFQACYAGFVVEEDFRTRGSSGGMGSWLLAELLRQNHVDGVIHVQENREGGVLFRYSVSRSVAEVKNGAKSRYYPVELSGVLEEVRRVPGRYAIVGLPCFLKGLRLLAKQDPSIASRITHYIGLVCGHLKSVNFAALLGWQAGIAPGDLRSVNFREKLNNRNANEYGFRAESSSRGVTRRMSEVLGGDWGLGLLKLNACDYCDDVLAETADIVVGDAWLPKFLPDGRGTNILVVRNLFFDEILKSAARDGRLHLESLTADEVADSQAAGLRHRREGLAYRLKLLQEKEEWYPPKRVSPTRKGIPRKRRRIYEIRLALSRRSHGAFRAALDSGRLERFLQQIDPLLVSYQKAYRGNLARKVFSKIERAWRRFRMR